MCPPGTNQQGRGSYGFLADPSTKGGKALQIVFWSFSAVAAVVACPLLICAAPVVGVVKAPKIVKRSEWYKTRQRKKECQPPKPEKRPRMLSISGDIQAETGKEKTDTGAQLQSLFFKLPYELRRQIYEEVVGNLTVHIIRIDDKLCAYPCTGMDVYQDPRGDCWVKRAYLSSTGLAARQGDPSRYHDPGIGLMALLMSCRRLYTEFVDVLYSETTFIFEGYLSMLDFCGSVLSQRFNVISSVQFNNTTPSLRPVSRQLGLQGSYATLRKIAIRNDHLPVLPVDDTRHGAWNHILMLLREMDALKKLKVDLDFFSLRPHDTDTLLPESMSTLEDRNLSHVQVRIHAKWDSTKISMDTMKRACQEMRFIETVHSEHITGIC